MKKNAKEKSINQINVGVDAFLEKRNANTSSLLAEILNESQGLGSFKDVDILKRVGSMFPLMDEDVLRKIIAKPECPDILGILVACYGSANLQNYYLFGDDYLDGEAVEKFVNTRPAKIKKRILQRGILEVVSPLLRYDLHSFLGWAKDLGFDVELDQSESWKISDAKQAFNFWEEDNLISPKREMEEKYMTSKDKYKYTMQTGIFEALGQMGYDYHQNGWSNDYGFLSKNIRDWLFHEIYGIKSKIVRQSVRIDACILSAKNGYPFNHFEFDVSSALMRLDSVVAAWCKKHPDPIFLSP